MIRRPGYPERDSAWRNRGILVEWLRSRGCQAQATAFSRLAAPSSGRSVGRSSIVLPGIRTLISDNSLQTDIVRGGLRGVCVMRHRGPQNQKFTNLQANRRFQHFPGTRVWQLTSEIPPAARRFASCGFRTTDNREGLVNGMRQNTVFWVL